MATSSINVFNMLAKGVYTERKDYFNIRYDPEKKIVHYIDEDGKVRKDTKDVFEHKIQVGKPDKLSFCEEVIDGWKYISYIDELGHVGRIIIGREITVIREKENNVSNGVKEYEEKKYEYIVEDFRKDYGIPEKEVIYNISKHVDDNGKYVIRKYNTDRRISKWLIKNKLEKKKIVEKPKLFDMNKFASMNLSSFESSVGTVVRNNKPKVYVQKFDKPIDYTKTQYMGKTQEGYPLFKKYKTFFYVKNDGTKIFLKNFLFK